MEKYKRKERFLTSPMNRGFKNYWQYLILLIVWGNGLYNTLLEVVKINTLLEHNLTMSFKKNVLSLHFDLTFRSFPCRYACTGMLGCLILSLYIGIAGCEPMSIDLERCSWAVGRGESSMYCLFSFVLEFNKVDAYLTTST